MAVPVGTLSIYGRRGGSRKWRPISPECRADGTVDKSRTQIVAAVGALSSEPRPSGCRKLVGTEAYRLRVGRYRIVYTVEDRIVTVTVVRVADRKHAYR